MSSWSGTAAMSWLAWQCALLLALLVVVLHRAALGYVQRLALRRLKRRTHRWLRSSVASSVHDALLPLLPAALLASAYTADAQLCAAQSLRIEWPLASCLRSITVHLQQPLVDITLQPADDGAADERNSAADKQQAARSAGAAATHPPPASQPLVISSSQAVVLRWFRVTIIATDIRCHITAPGVAVDVQVAAVKADVGWSRQGEGGLEGQLRLDDCAATLRYTAAVASQQVVFPSTLLHSKLLTASAVLPFHRTASPLLPRRVLRSSPPSAEPSPPPHSSSRTFYTYTPALHALQVELGWDGLKGDARLDQLCCAIACLHLTVDALSGRSGKQRRSRPSAGESSLPSAASLSAPVSRPPLPIVLKAPSKVSGNSLLPTIVAQLTQSTRSRQLTFVPLSLCRVAVRPTVECVPPAASCACINSSATADRPHLLLTRPTHSHLSHLYIPPRRRLHLTTLAVTSAHYPARPSATHYHSLSVHRSRAARPAALTHAACAPVAVVDRLLSHCRTTAGSTRVHSADAVVAACTLLGVHQPAYAGLSLDGVPVRHLPARP